MGLKKKFSRYREAQSGEGGGPLLRASFGLTQLQLALLLGVSREVMAAYEKGRRYLPEAAATLLYALVAAVRELPAPAVAPVPGPAPALSDYTQESLRLRLMAINLEAYRLREQLARSQTQVAQMRRRQQALPDLQAALPPGNAYAARWLTQFAADAADLLALEEPQAALLALKLRVLAFEQSETTKLLGEDA